MATVPRLQRLSSDISEISDIDHYWMIRKRNRWTVSKPKDKRPQWKLLSRRSSRTAAFPPSHVIKIKNIGQKRPRTGNKIIQSRNEFSIIFSDNFAINYIFGKQIKVKHQSILEQKVMQVLYSTADVFLNLKQN